MEPSERLRQSIHLTAGLMLLALALGADALLGRPVDWSLFRFGLIALAAGVAVLGRIRLPRRLATSLLAACLVGSGFFILLAILELVFRFSGIGVAIDRRAWNAVPLYFRQPLTPFGDGFYRRSGPTEWTGRALHERVRQLGIQPNPYADDPVVTAKYDADGFRNEAELKDWEIAVTGDSFTELGYLRHADLFTSVLATQSGRPVRNLGVSYTGPRSQLAYLKAYGTSSSVKHWMMVFFEGNDFDDLRNEVFAQAQPADQRPERKFDGSLIKRLDGALRSVVWRIRGTHGWPNADLISGNERQPVTLNYAPPGSADLSSSDKNELVRAFRQFSEAAAETEVTPWIVYVPCKRRIWHGRLEYRSNCPIHVREWRPNDLPKFVQQTAEENGLRFLDATEVMGQLEAPPFNSVYDTHLTAAGSRALGGLLAEAIQEPPPVATPAAEPASKTKNP